MSGDERTRGSNPKLEATWAAYDEAPVDYQAHWRARRPLDAIRKFAQLAGRDARVLDVAAGPALDVRLLRDAGLKVVAGDLSHESMRVARTLHPKGALARWDYRRLPFADGTFDGLWAPAALQHVPRSMVRSTLREWRRVQRRGPFFLTMREGRGDLEPVEDPPVGTVYITTVTGDELKALLLAEGWAEVEVESRPDPLGRAGIVSLHAFAQLRA